MEYPTLITAWGAEDKTPDQELERVVVHEIGHQYFYGLVASNEFEEAWLDEGFTSYAEDKVMEADFGVTPNLPVESSYITSPNALRQNAWAYTGHDQYAENVYTRGKLVLKAIEKQVGTKTMDRIMRTYFQNGNSNILPPKTFKMLSRKYPKRSGTTSSMNMSTAR